MNKQRIIIIIFAIAALCCFTAGIIWIAMNKKMSLGILWLSLGLLSIANAYIWAKDKNKKSDSKDKTEKEE